LGRVENAESFLLGGLEIERRVEDGGGLSGSSDDGSRYEYLYPAGWKARSKRRIARLSDLIVLARLPYPRNGTYTHGPR
jgi:hypothetical protein